MIEGETGAEGAAVETPDTSDYVVYNQQEAENEAQAQAQAETKPFVDDKLPEAATGDEGESSEAPKKLGGFQRKLMAKDQEIVQLREQLAKFEPKPAAQAPQKSAGDDGRPNPNDYTDVTDYIDAAAEWKLEARDRRAAEEKQQAQFTEKKMAVLEDLHSTDPEFAEALISHETIINKKVDAAILESPAAKDILLFMKQNPDSARYLSSLNETQLYKKIGQVEAALDAAKSSEVREVAAVRQTRAAAPISPVKVTSSTAKSISDDMPYEDWVKQREASLRR